MKVCLVECGSSKLLARLSAAADKMKPKPELSVIQLNMAKFRAPEYKNALYSLAPDVIIINPPNIEIDGSPDPTDWAHVIAHAVRHSTMMSGKLVFISSVEAIGDGLPRTEICTAMPDTDQGIFLQASEMLIEPNLSRHFTLRFPYTSETPRVANWIHGNPTGKENEIFTLTSTSAVAYTILDVIQGGWFGTFHPTPGDSLLLSTLLPDNPWDLTIKVPNRSLASKIPWANMPKSRDIWDDLMRNRICEASRT